MADLKRALISGCTGQDGSYLAEYLLELGYEVHGMIRIASTDATKNIKHLLSNKDLIIHYGDLNDYSSLASLINKVEPDEVYNLGALTHVGLSFDYPEQHLQTTAGGALRLLEVIRKTTKRIKFYQASTSELYGDTRITPQSESTPFNPTSPYAIAKHYAFQITKLYREAYNIFACNGILFNHESPRRGDNFVTKKVVHTMVENWKRKNGVLELGNMDAKRDWGYAGDYVKGMHLIMQYGLAGDYVLATGETHTVREFVEEVAKNLMIDLVWSGSGLDEVGKDNKTGEILVRINPKFYRPSDVNFLIGDASKADRELGWKAETKFKDLVKMMVEAELK